MSFINAENFLLNTSLYESIEFDFYDLEDLINVILNKNVLDCYCLECGKDSTFHPAIRNVQQYPITNIESIFQSKINLTHEDKLERLRNYYSDLIEYQHYVQQYYNCSRNAKHQLYFSFLIKGNKLSKIGQTPSLADLNQLDIKKYRKLLGDEKYTELNKGIGLFSHGIGIGSFVYLRRIFEYLIVEAQKNARVTISNWDDQEFESKRMDEKIKLLSDFLPNFLVENRIIYSILSKGVHELSEDECKEIFPHVKLGIELILDEKLAEEEKQKKIKSAKLSLSKIGERLASRVK